jgi:hypothetical protein
VRPLLFRCCFVWAGERRRGPRTPRKQLLGCVLSSSRETRVAGAEQEETFGRSSRGWKIYTRESKTRHPGLPTATGEDVESTMNVCGANGPSQCPASSTLWGSTPVAFHKVAQGVRVPCTRCLSISNH